MSRKFELRLPVSAKNKKFAESCHDALFKGGTVFYKRKQHRVYHYSQHERIKHDPDAKFPEKQYEDIDIKGNFYLIGLVPVDEE